MNKLILLPLILILSACATGSSLTPEQQKKALEPIACKDKAECDVMWQRTQAWVAQNSHWRIQMLTDTLLQTFGPGDDAFPAFTATKQLQKDGSAKILMSVTCGNPFGCIPTPIDALYSFQEAVRQ